MRLMKTWSPCVFSIGLFPLFVSVNFAQQAPGSAPTTAATHLKEEMRAPWTRSNERFLRHWLALSDIPLAGTSQNPDAAALEVGFDRDWLAEHGGETAVRPVEKMTHQLPNGKSVQWRDLKSWGDSVNLSDGYGLKRNMVSYAFATVSRNAAGRALLCIGSNGSIRVWVNGARVLDRRTQRTLTFDEDQVEVDLKSGDNTLLVKLEELAGPGFFSARVLERGSVPARIQEIGPSVTDAAGDELVARTDVGTARAAMDPVKVEAVAAGGHIVAEQSAARGTDVHFATASWPAGPYEFRFSTRRLNGLLYVTHIPWYKGDAIAEARQLTATAAKADATTPQGATLHMLADMVQDRVGKDLDGVTGNPWWAIHSPLMEFEEMQLEAAGQPAIVRPYGFLRLAYRDEVDGSPQFCRVYLPGGYDPAKKWPVLIHLHGYNGENPDYVRWWSVDQRHNFADVEYAGHQGIIFVDPHGRGNTQYLGLGDADIVRVIELLKKRLSVDEDRVYLLGESMGGWGTWNVATRHPELFAAIAPTFGGSDYHSTLSEEELAKLTPPQRFLQDKNSSWSMADGLLNMPILVHHGDADQNVNVDFSRYGVRMLQRWGYNVRYIEMPGYAHEDLNAMEDEINWLLAQRRVAQPSHVRIRSAELQHASAYWARIDQAASPAEFMVADIEVAGPNLIRLDSENVLAVTLSPAAPLIDAGKPVEVVWNGESHKLNVQDGRLVLRAAGYNPSPGEKSALVAGPLGDIFNTPFAVVYGTSSADPAMNDLLRQKADGVADFWRQWQHQPARIFRDSELTDADAPRYSLLLIGGPDSNLVARRFAGKLPLELTTDTIEAGGRAFAVKDACAQAIAPNPLNAQRYVLEVAATSTDGMYFCSPANLQSSEYDFLIQDGRMPDGTQRVSGSDLRVASGWFDREWKAREELTVLGSAEQRAKAVLLPAPRADRALDAKLLDALAGDYQIPSGPTLKVFRKEHHLMIEVGEQADVELVPLTNLEYYIVEGPARVLFEKDATDKIADFKVWQNGQTFTAKRLQ